MMFILVVENFITLLMLSVANIFFQYGIDWLVWGCMVVHEGYNPVIRLFN